MTDVSDISLTSEKKKKPSGEDAGYSADVVRYTGTKQT